MKYIISGTDREGSNSLKVAQIIQKIYKNLEEKREENVEIIDLRNLSKELMNGPYYGASLPPLLTHTFENIVNSEGLIVVVPEYNGSMPGILKYFIDHMKFPESFEFKPVCFVGLGGMFGGLRPVEHLQQVFGYRNAYIYPVRVFMTNVWKSMNENQNGEFQLKDRALQELLEKQAKGFGQFVTAVNSISHE